MDLSVGRTIADMSNEILEIAGYKTLCYGDPPYKWNKTFSYNGLHIFNNYGEITIYWGSPTFEIVYGGPDTRVYVCDSFDKTPRIYYRGKWEDVFMEAYRRLPELERICRIIDDWNAYVRGDYRSDILVVETCHPDVVAYEVVYERSFLRKRRYEECILSAGTWIIKDGPALEEMEWIIDHNK